MKKEFNSIPAKGWCNVTIVVGSEPNAYGIEPVQPRLRKPFPHTAYSIKELCLCGFTESNSRWYIYQSLHEGLPSTYPLFKKAARLPPTVDYPKINYLVFLFNFSSIAISMNLPMGIAVFFFWSRTLSTTELSSLTDSKAMSFSICVPQK